MAMISMIWYSQLDQKENEKRKSEAEKLARDAELYNLRQQLQPHFLFNSLNSINALIGFKPDEARKMIHQLSDFLRGTLKKDDQQNGALNRRTAASAIYTSILKKYVLVTVWKPRSAAIQNAGECYAAIHAVAADC